MFRLEGASLQFHHHIAVQLQVIEQQVDEEVIAAHLQRHLPPDEGKTCTQLQQKLGDVLRRNSIVGIAEKVESQQELLNLASDKFYRLQIDIQQQQEFLKTYSTFIDDSFISEETEKKQTELRKQMQTMEKEYIDVKFNCYDFLSGTLKK